MLRQLVVRRKIDAHRKALEALLEDEATLQARSEELGKAIDGAETDEELEAVEASVTELEEKKTKLAEKKTQLESEIKALEGELEELNSKAPSTSERQKGSDHVDEREQLRHALDRYVRSKGKAIGELRDVDGFKVVDGGVLVPEEILPAQEKPEDVVDLRRYVRVRQVNRGSGKIPVIKKSGSKMVSVAELEKNPELAKPEITDVSYDIETYRGYIPISEEVIDDADYDIVGLIREEIDDQELNTVNEAIAAVLKAAPAKTAENLDDLKKIFNVDLKRVYNTRVYMSASLYHELDTLKDSDGRYLLQDNITAASGKSLFGREVVVLDDEVIGENPGDLVAFIGDAYEFCTFFDRKRASVRWTDHNIYGELLASFVRFDVAAVDTDAGYYVTYVPEV